MRPGGFATASTPFVVQPSNLPQTGTGIAPYTVLTLVYAPGTKGGNSTSSVEYGSESSMGTITSISRSFNAGLNIGTNFEEVVGFDFSLSRTDTKSSSLEIKKTTSLDLAVNGPSTDGPKSDESLSYLDLGGENAVSGCARQNR